MSDNLVGEIHGSCASLQIREEVPSEDALLAAKDFSLQMSLGAEHIELSLADIRKLKQILTQGEELLKTRFKQADRKRNYELAF